ncbi:MAG: type II toxin-antitoxin system RelB/DinJ family antitoxin [Defluviitaleaceae bacterium]|nr:type II toxin-antitoxin system RelB/DinJ family antitoxin [Defluviitaleaceae bacterium]
MDKTATLNLRVNPDVKKSAESVLQQLGVPMATAIDMFLKQISLTGGIPFPVTLPKVPDHVNADLMSTAEIRALLDEGLDDIEAGRVSPAREVFARFRERYVE